MIEDLQRKGRLKGLSEPVVRRLAAGGMAKHYKGDALDIIVQALESERSS